MIHGNDSANHALTQADHLWPDCHADRDAKAPFYRVAEGVFMFQLTRPVGILVVLVYKDAQIEAICIVKGKPIMHPGIGPAQASRSETSADAEPSPEIEDEEYTSALDTEQNEKTTETPPVPPVVVINIDQDADDFSMDVTGDTTDTNESLFNKEVTKFWLYIEPYTGQCSLCPTDNTTTVYTEIQKCFGTKPVCDEVPTAKPTPSGLPPLLPLMKPGLYKTRSLPTPINLGKLQSLAINYKDDQQKSPLLEQWEDLFTNPGEECVEEKPTIPMKKSMDEKPTNPGEICMDGKPTKPLEKCMDEKPNMDITADYHMMETETGTGDYKWSQPLSDAFEGNQNKKMKFGKKKEWTFSLSKEWTFSVS